MIHLLISYHTCPFEEPGVGLAGGMNVFLRGLLAGFSRRGLPTIVLTRGRGGTILETRPLPGLRVFHVPCGWEEPPSRESARRSLPAFAAGAKALLADLAPRPGVVSAHYWMSGLVALELRQVLPDRPAVVLAYHTVEARRGEPEGPPGSLSSARRREEARLSREADRVVCFTEDDLADTERLFPAIRGKGAVIAPGVDEAFRAPPPRDGSRDALGIPRGAFAFLLAARPDPTKGVEAAVAAFGALPAEESGGPLLLIAGRDAPPGDAPERVRFLGPVPHARMPALYASADAVLCPSAYESFGLVQLEALACGVPVVVPAGGYWGRRIASEGGGLAYAPEEPQGLLGAMTALARDRSFAVRLAEEAVRLASPFTWERCTEDWTRLLARAATPGSRR